MCDDSSLRESLMERLVKVYCHEGFFFKDFVIFFLGECHFGYINFLVTY